MKNEPFTTTADKTALAAAGAPARGLGEEAYGHQRSGNKCCGVHMNPAGEQDDVERCIAAVEQGRSDQIENRTEQGEEQVAQRGLQCLRLAIETDQRHRGEGEKLDRDV